MFDSGKRRSYSLTTPSDSSKPKPTQSGHHSLRKSITTSSIVATNDQKSILKSRASFPLFGHTSSSHLFTSNGEPAQNERSHGSNDATRTITTDQSDKRETIDQCHGSLITRNATISDAERSESRCESVKDETTKVHPSATEGRPQQQNTGHSDSADHRDWTSGHRSAEVVNNEWSATGREESKSSTEDNDATEINNNRSDVDATDNTVASGHSIDRGSRDDHYDDQSNDDSTNLSMQSTADHLDDHSTDHEIDHLHDHAVDHLNGHLADHGSDHSTPLSMNQLEHRLSLLSMESDHGSPLHQVTSILSTTTSGPSIETEAALAAEAEEEHPYFARIAAEAVEAGPIVSPRGTVRGVRNRVRSGIASFLEKNQQRKTVNYAELERGRIVFYTTTVTAVRETFDQCLKVKRILQTQMVEFEERNVFVSKQLHQQLIERLQLKTNSNLKLPQVFVDGYHLGDAKEIERLNESGVLRKIFNNFKKVQHPVCCTRCGGYRFIPCLSCHGSKKSRRNHLTNEFFVLRCTSCDDNGLVRCEQCNNITLTEDGNEPQTNRVTNSTFA